MGTRQGDYTINGEHWCSVGHSTAYRPCILARNNIQAFPVPELYSSIIHREGSIRKITVTVVYLCYDSSESLPPREL